MKTTWIGAVVLLAVVTVGAQNYAVGRVSQMADDLKSITGRLADRTMQDALRGSSNSRSEIQDALLAQHLDGSAALLAEMVRNRRPGDEVRQVMDAINEQARRMPSFSNQNQLWRSAQNAINELDRELRSFNPGPPGPPGPPPRPIIGRVTWRGMVDDRVQLVIRGNSIEQKLLSGTPQPAGTFNFTSGLPASDVEVSVDKQTGRGTVRVLQQPSRQNDFTAVIEIFDETAGAREYRLDIYWQARGR